MGGADRRSSQATRIHQARVHQGEHRLPSCFSRPADLSASLQEIGWTHMRILEGVGTLVQLGGLISRLSKLSMKQELFVL